jgi:hypothetical protein
MRALRVLAIVPHSGRIEDTTSAYAGFMSKLVRVRRGWTYRIIYEVGARWVTVHSVAPPWQLPGTPSD